MTNRKHKDTSEHCPYKPHGAAFDLFRCRDPEVLIEGPAGTGKSRAALEKANLLAWKYPGMRALLVRKTRRSMTESTLVTFEEKVVPADWAVLRGPSRSTRQSYHYPNGSTLVLGGLDRASKIMSTEYDLILAFEACELTEADWETLLTRLRNGRMPYQQAIADTNPGAPAHWLNRRADSGAITRLISRHGDNPTVTSDYLTRLSKLSGVRHLRLCRGLWAASEGLVYEDWDPQVHLIGRFPIPADWRRIRVIDFGYTNPFVCQWWAIDEDERMYLYREVYMTRRLVQDHAVEIIELSRDEVLEATISDHDAEGRATLEHYDVVTLPARKAITTGIQAVASRLRRDGDGRPRLFILRDSLTQRDGRLEEARLPWATEQEFDSYVWSDFASGRGTRELPIKLNDHGMDALRYAVAYIDGFDSMPLSVHLCEQAVSPVGEELLWAS
jgi:PBSX family phage terminase large subunit